MLRTRSARKRKAPVATPTMTGGGEEEEEDEKSLVICEAKSETLWESWSGDQRTVSMSSWMDDDDDMLL
ncbi:hypothetical protein Hanom_Chr11g00968031 [Helianthus anomalus]